MNLFVLEIQLVQTPRKPMQAVFALKRFIGSDAPYPEADRGRTGNRLRKKGAGRCYGCGRKRAGHIRRHTCHAYARTMSAVAFVIMSVGILRTGAGKKKYLIIVRTAVRRKAFVSVAAAWAAVMAVTAMAVFRRTFMPRMYVAAFHAADDRRQKTASVTLAGVHIEAYDTYTVPQGKQGGTIFPDCVSHNNLQR